MPRGLAMSPRGICLQQETSRQRESYCCIQESSWGHHNLQECWRLCHGIFSCTESFHVVQRIQMYISDISVYIWLYFYMYMNFFFFAVPWYILDWDITYGNACLRAKTHSFQSSRHISDAIFTAHVFSMCRVPTWIMCLTVEHWLSGMCQGWVIVFAGYHRSHC